MEPNWNFTKEAIAEIEAAIEKKRKECEESGGTWVGEHPGHPEDQALSLDLSMKTIMEIAEHAIANGAIVRPVGMSDEPIEPIKFEFTPPTDSIKPFLDPTLYSLDKLYPDENMRKIYEIRDEVAPEQYPFLSKGENTSGDSDL